MLSFSSWLDFIPIYAAKKWEQNPVHSYFYLLPCAKVFLPVSTPPPSPGGVPLWNVQYNVCTFNE